MTTLCHQISALWKILPLCHTMNCEKSERISLNKWTCSLFICKTGINFKLCKISFVQI